MMTYYLREKNGLPSACLAIESQGNQRLVYAIAAWNAKLDVDAFDRRKSRMIAMGRVNAINPDIEVNTHLCEKRGSFIGGVLPHTERPFETVLKHIVAAATFPQRVRDAAKRTLRAIKLKALQQDHVRVQPPEAPEGNDHDHDGA